MREGRLLPEIRRDRGARSAALAAYLLFASMGAAMFGAGRTVEDHGWTQLADDFGTACGEWPLGQVGCLAAMAVGLLWPRTPLVLLGVAGAFVTPLGACLVQSMRIT